MNFRIVSYSLLSAIASIVVLNADAELLQNVEDTEFPLIAQSQVLRPIQSGVRSKFGSDIELDGNTLVITSRNSFGDYHGSVDIYEYENAEWQFVKTLYSPNNQAGEGFGRVALDGDTLMVGSPSYTPAGPGIDTQGVVYVFERNEGGPEGWGLVQQLDGGFKWAAFFGIELDIHDNTAVVHSREPLDSSENDGAVYIFERNYDTLGEWGLVKKIESDDSWDIRQPYSGGGFVIYGDSVFIPGRDSSGLVIREFGRNEGGQDNWGLVAQIIDEGMGLWSADFDGETLVTTVVDNPSVRTEQYLRFYERNAARGWSEYQSIQIEFELEAVAIDGPLAFVGSGGQTLGYLLRRGPALDSWAFTQELVFDGDAEFEGAWSPVMGAGQLVFGDPYSNASEGLVVVYSLDIPINVGHAGAWFNTATSGQGQLIDVEPENQFMFVSWFTYTPADSDHPLEQHWFTAQGNYIGNKAEVTVYETLGGKFDDPQAVNTSAVGEATVSFSGCDFGQMNYTIDTLGLHGEIPLQRAIPGSGNTCQQQANTTQSVDINAGMDGAWFDENTSGQGFLIDAHPNPEGGNFIFVAWFTYGDDTASGQRWLTAQGNFEGSTAAIEVYESTGGNFDDSQAVSTDMVGTMTIDFQDCNNALLSYVLTDEGLSNSIAISRAIPGAQALCEELVASD